MNNLNEKKSPNPEILPLDGELYRLSKMVEKVRVESRQTINPSAKQVTGEREFFTPTPEQFVQICLVIFQAAVLRREQTDKKNIRSFSFAEDILSATRNALFQALVPYIANANRDKAMRLAQVLLKRENAVVKKYAKYWHAIAKPKQMFRNGSDTIFLARRAEGDVVVGLNNYDTIFYFDEESYLKDFPEE